MARTALTRTEARKRARERSAAIREREERLVGLVADWEVAQDALHHSYVAMYDAGLTRSEIAQRTGQAVGRVPKLDELVETVDDDASEVSGDDVNGASDDAAERGE